MLHVPLSPDTEAKLREPARTARTAHAARLIHNALAAPAVDELLAPLRKQVDASGISDEELDALGDELREEVWQEQQARKAKSA